MSEPKKRKPKKAPPPPSVAADPVEAEAEAMIQESNAEAAAPAPEMKQETEIPEEIREILQMEMQIRELSLIRKTQVRTAFVLVSVVAELGARSKAAGQFDENGSPRVLYPDFWKEGIFPLLQALAVELPRMGIPHLDAVQNALAHLWTGGPLEELQPPPDE